MTLGPGSEKSQLVKFAGIQEIRLQCADPPAGPLSHDARVVTPHILEEASRMHVRYRTVENASGLANSTEPRGVLDGVDNDPFTTRNEYLDTVESDGVCAEYALALHLGKAELSGVLQPSWDRGSARHDYEPARR